MMRVVDLASMEFRVTMRDAQFHPARAIDENAAFFPAYMTTIHDILIQFFFYIHYYYVKNDAMDTSVRSRGR